MAHAALSRRVLTPLLATLLLPLLPPFGPAGGAEPPSLSAPGRQPGELERVQMHRNGLRGVHYLPTRRADGRPEPDRFTLKPTSDFPLDGDPQLNVRGGVYPLDGDGDGRFGFLHFNGYRVMRAYTQLGRKLWQVDNPGGKVHRSIAHRFTLAVFDADGGPGQEIVHCWSAPGTADKLLVLRDGQTGEVLKQVRLAGQGKDEECHIAAFRVEGSERPLILVAGKAADRDCAKGNWTPYFAKTMAFRPDLSKLWERTTCAAGHYAWPLDEDGDGAAEAVFVGKYLLRPEGGTTRCVLPIGADHVDSMVVGDLDPDLGGPEALAVGETGTRFFRAGGCALRWRIPRSTTANPQQTGAAHLSAGVAAPSLLVTNKLNATEGGPEDLPLRGSTIDAQGRVVATYVDEAEIFAAPSQNANLDGAPAAEDRVTTFGQVVDGRGRRRLTVDWYWGLQELTPEEEALDPRERWSRNPFAFDLDGDGRDELVVWGRRKLVAGTLAASTNARARVAQRW
jgi:hypothetical protein